MSLIEAVETVGVGNVNPEVETAELTLAELAHQDLQAVYKGVGQLAAFEAQLRVDCTGYIGEQVKVGGALVVKCTLLTPDGPIAQRLDIDDDYRPLSEPTITFLGEEANKRRDTKGDVITNYISTNF